MGMYTYTYISSQVISNCATNTQNVHQRKWTTGAAMINHYIDINFVGLFTGDVFNCAMGKPATQRSKNLSAAEIQSLDKCPTHFEGVHFTL